MCAAKIQARRIIEVQNGVQWAYENGYKCILITFTFPHNYFQTCKDLLERQREAFKYFRSGKVWQRIKKEMGYEGLIRSLEVKYGENGWHPHTHELCIVDKEIDVEELKEKVLDRWKKACEKFGLLPSNRTEAFEKHAVDIIDNARTSDYLAKQSTIDSGNWGVDRELVGGSKKASKTGKSPFDLLIDYDNGDEKARELFLEYALAFHGKAQMFWSQGLKKKVGIQDKTDKDLVKEKEDSAVEVAVLEDYQWRKICEENARSEILDLAETEGPKGIEDWLRGHEVFERYSQVYFCVEGIDSS